MTVVGIDLGVFHVQGKTPLLNLVKRKFKCVCGYLALTKVFSQSAFSITGI